jgi:pimeloyl-ACP methyl ester carboxylesterase
MRSWQQFSVYLLFIVGPSLSLATQPVCHQVLLDKPHSSLVLNEPEETKPDWNSDKFFLEALRKRESLGVVQSFYSEKFQTQFYHTATGIPDAKGKSPLVDPESQGVVLFIHGSGTMKSSGRNFVVNMNTVAKLGYSAVSIDLPFHMKGPRSEEFHQSRYFMEWMRNIVRELEKSGKPIIMVGHSFGPDVILEFDARFPNVLAGYSALGIAGFNKITDKWYDEFTSKMKFGGDVPENDAGGIWAGQMSKQFLWKTGKLADPTVSHPKRARILSGNREEYVPAPVGGPNNTPIGENTYDVSIPLRAMLKGAVITIEPGVGHYLFEHVDANGHHVITREIMLALGENPADYKKLVDETKQREANHVASEKLQLKYAQDAQFRAWGTSRFGEGQLLRLARRHNEVLSKRITDEYILALKAREENIYQKILKTKETAPEFYNRYQQQIDASNPKKVDTLLFMPYLQAVLNADGAAQVNASGDAP